MQSVTSDRFWKGFGTTLGASFVWGLLCAFGDGRASDWPSYVPWTPSQRSLLEVPLVIGAWMAVATAIFVLARTGAWARQVWSRYNRSIR